MGAGTGLASVGGPPGLQSEFHGTQIYKTERPTSKTNKSRRWEWTELIGSKNFLNRYGGGGLGSGSLVTRSTHTQSFHCSRLLRILIKQVCYSANCYIVSKRTTARKVHRCLRGCILRGRWPTLESLPLGV